MSDPWDEYDKTRRRAARLFSVEIKARGRLEKSRLRDGPSSSLAEILCGESGLDPLPLVTLEAFRALERVRRAPGVFEKPETRYLAGLAGVHAIALRARSAGNAEAAIAGSAVLREMIDDFTRLRDSENGRNARGVPRRKRSAVADLIPDVDEILRKHPAWSLKRACERACERVASLRRVSPNALRVAYRRRKNR